MKITRKNTFLFFGISLLLLLGICLILIRELSKDLGDNFDTPKSHPWVSCQQHPKTAAPLPHTTVGSVSTKKQYTLWKGRRVDDEHQYLHELESRPELPNIFKDRTCATSHMPIRYIPENDNFKLTVPLEYYSWAKNLTRSASLSSASSSSSSHHRQSFSSTISTFSALSSKIILVSSLFPGFHDFIHSYSSLYENQQVIFIVLNQTDHLTPNQIRVAEKEIGHEAKRNVEKEEAKRREREKIIEIERQKQIQLEKIKEEEIKKKIQNEEPQDQERMEEFISDSTFEDIYSTEQESKEQEQEEQEEEEEEEKKKQKENEKGGEIEGGDEDVFMSFFGFDKKESKMSHFSPQEENLKQTQKDKYNEQQQQEEEQYGEEEQYEEQEEEEEEEEESDLLNTINRRRLLSSQNKGPHFPSRVPKPLDLSPIPSTSTSSSPSLSRSRSKLNKRTPRREIKIEKEEESGSIKSMYCESMKVFFLQSDLFILPSFSISPSSCPSSSSYYSSSSSSSSPTPKKSSKIGKRKSSKSKSETETETESKPMSKEQCEEKEEREREERMKIVSKYYSILSLIEISDLFISVDGYFYYYSQILETPVLSIFSSSSLSVSLSPPSISSTLPLSSTVTSCNLPNSNQNIISKSLNQFTPVTPDKLSSFIEEIGKVKKSKEVDLMFHSYVDPNTGYGSSAQQILLAFHKTNTSTRFLPRQPLPKDWESKVEWTTQELVNRYESSATYLGYYVVHEHEVRDIHRYARKAKHLFIYTTFETTKVPSSWPSIVNHFDKLFVSCHPIRTSFRNSGVTIPIEVVPLGISTENWPFMERDWSAPFRFLMFADGSWKHHRKNYNLVYEAFINAFVNETSTSIPTTTTTTSTKLSKSTTSSQLDKPEDHGSLQKRLKLSKLKDNEIDDIENKKEKEKEIKKEKEKEREKIKEKEKKEEKEKILQSKNNQQTTQKQRTDVELLIKISSQDFGSGESMETMPSSVRIFSGRYTQPKLLQLLKRANCLVFPSKGEGYGLPPREAMATGIPVILAGFAGLEPIADEEMNYPLNFTLEKASGYDMWISENEYDSDFGEWASISVKELTRVMKKVIEEPEVAREKGLKASKFIHNSATYQKTAISLLKAMKVYSFE